MSRVALKLCGTFRGEGQPLYQHTQTDSLNRSGHAILCCGRQVRTTSIRAGVGDTEICPRLRSPCAALGRQTTSMSTGRIIPAWRMPETDATMAARSPCARKREIPSSTGRWLLEGMRGESVGIQSAIRRLATNRSANLKLLTDVIST